MNRAWLLIPKEWPKLFQLSSSHDNGQSMVIPPSGMKHAPLVFFVFWQRSKHDDTLLRYEACSVICHISRQPSEHRSWFLRHKTSPVSCQCLMTMERAWLLIFKIWNMLCQLSSSHDNDQSTVISSYMNYALSVVIISWQWSSHGF